MNGLSFVADTNFLIAVHNGEEFVEPFLDSSIVVSAISEVELLDWHKISSKEKLLLRSLLDDCILLELTADIRKIAIEIRQKIRIKTPDAIAAATSIYLQLPLVTSDNGFKNIPGIELILV